MDLMEKIMIRNKTKTNDGTTMTCLTFKNESQTAMKVFGISLRLAALLWFQHSDSSPPYIKRHLTSASSSKLHHTQHTHGATAAA